jgi:histidinol-phosphate/aromatic aminotransferase/cobyric acid decarboxylase-like protein/GTP:adenosylcobinamide-phosphate guanylyltransferase
MQAIILAAGMGRRLGDYTKDNTKCMVAVNGERLIDRVLKQLSCQAIDRVIIVIGYKGDNLKRHITENYKGRLKIEFVENPIYDKTNNIYSLSLVSQQMKEDDTLLIESDLIFSDKLFGMIMDDPSPNVALVAKYESWMDGTMVKIDADSNIVNFVPKKAFDYSDVDEYYKTVNIYKFSKEFSQTKYVPFLDAYSKALGNNEYYEQVLRVITLIDSANLKALPVDGEKWYEIDDVQDLDIASCLFSEKEVKYKEYHRRYGGYWRFPQVMDYCYLVNPFFPPKRLRDEMRANFDILLESYPSGMYVNSLLAGKYFGVNQEYIVVGNGAAELIKLVMEQHAEDRVGMIFPTFDEYPNRLRPEQIVPYVVETPDFTYSADDLMDFYADKNIKLLLLINPDNPSGNFIPVDDVLRLAEWCEQGGIRLLLDESFVDFTYGFENNSLLRNDVMEHCPNMMVMKSISKSYGVPGLRLGVLASANKDMIALMKKEVSIWNINSMAEFYMQIYGKYEADYKKACRLFIKERERFFEDLQTVPYLRVVPSQANYFLCEVTDKYTSAELAQKCIENDVVISNCGLKRNMANKQLIRLAVRSRKDNERLIEILKSFA